MHANTSENTHQLNAHTKQPKAHPEAQTETQIEVQIKAKTDASNAPPNPIPDLKLKDFKWVPVLLVCYYLAGYLFVVLSKPLLPLGENGEGFISVAGLFFMFILVGFWALFYFRNGTTFKQLLILSFVSLPLIVLISAAVVLVLPLIKDSFFINIMIWPLINLTLFGSLLLIRIEKHIGSNPSFLLLFSHLIILLLIFLLSVFVYAMHQPGDS